MFTSENWSQRLRQVLNTNDVDHHGTSPVLSTRCEEGFDGMDVSGVVNDTVNCVLAGKDGLHRFLDGGWHTQVAGRSEGIWSDGLHVGGRFLKFRTVPGEEDDADTCTSQCQGDFTPDAFGCASDEVGLPL